MTGEEEKVEERVRKFTERDVINSPLLWLLEEREHELLPSNTCVHYVSCSVTYAILVVDVTGLVTC